MAKVLSEYVDEVGEICHDEDKALNDPLIEKTVKRAARILSRQKPHRSVADITGNASSTMWAMTEYATDWEPNFSILERAWFPFVADTEGATDELDSSDFDVFEYSTGVWYFRLFNHTPSASEIARFQYTAFHTITDAASTIDSDAEEDSVLWLAASFCFEVMAAKAAALNNPGLGTDLADFGARVQHYLNIAKEYAKKSGLVAMSKDEAKGAVVFSDWDRRPPSGFWISHPYKKD